MQTVSMMSDDDMFNLESNWWIEDKILKDNYENSENTVVNNFITIIDV